MHQKRFFNVYALVGFILIVFPLFFVTANILKFELGIGILYNVLDNYVYSKPAIFRIFDDLSPPIFIGGLLFAILLNLYPIFRYKIKKGSSASFRQIALQENPVNFVIVFSSLVILLTIAAYLFAENF